MKQDASDPIQRVVRDQARLQAVRRTGLLDSAPEESFDRLTRLAVKLTGVPASFVSFVDEFRDFYKSHCGFGEPLATVRQLEGTTFCHYAIAHGETLVIPDTGADPTFRRVPTVQSLGVAAYLGVPLRAASGEVLGSFCAIDFKPKQWSQTEIEVLTELAMSAEREVQLREAARNAEEQALAAQELAARLRTQTAELETTNAALVSMNVELDEFAHAVSHDLRAPLRGIANLAQWLEDDCAGELSDTARSHLSLMKARVVAMNGLIEGLLGYSRTTRSAEAAVEVDVGQLLSQVVDLLSIPPRVQVAVQGPMPRLVTEMEPLRQVLLNLIGNAVKFNDAANPRVELSARQTTQGFEVCVADNGPGIDAEFQAKIFGVFCRLENARAVEGTGLGLAIVKRVVEKRGGRVWVQSEKGKGATFRFTWPAAKPPPLPQQPSV